MLKDRSGQLMLISALLLAMMVVAITLMLNNVIYSSNMAYVGFMDQSRYDDLAYKQATSREAIYAYSAETTDPLFVKHMEDYEKALNNITSMKGQYVDLDSQITSTGPMTHTRTLTQLSIYGKDSNTS